MNPERIIHIALDESSIGQRSPEAEHERVVAITDLLADNLFNPIDMACGPYEVLLSIREGRLVFDIYASQMDRRQEVTLAISPLKRLVRDYFLICESYYQAIKEAKPHKLEAIDMGRRGVHNEGAEALQVLLDDKIKVDFKTARRLFTLICVLHIK